MLCVVVSVLISMVTSDCRFAPKYSAEELWNPDIQVRFLQEVAQAESGFHQAGVSFDAITGYTYDGHMLDYTTGELLPGGLHNFSAPSKESLHLALLALAISGNPMASTFVIGSNSANATNATAFAVNILSRKIATYEKFNQSYPGFGGFMPWVVITPGGVLPDSPAWDNQVPALDNGEMIWAMYAVAHALRQFGFSELSDRYFAYLAYLAKTAQMVFYRGDGNVSWVTNIVDAHAKPTPHNYFATSSDPGDPYEGELFTWFLDLFTTWPSENDRDEMWIGKRAMLQSVNYTTIQGLNITVQRGFWFSAHENWKLAFMPYFDVEIAYRIFRNCERARTVHSSEHQIAGLYACVNDVTSGPGEPIPDYIGTTGIPSIAFEPDIDWRTDVVTPYGIYTLALTNISVAIQWYHNMLIGPRMQGPFGSTESVALNGTEICPLVTWDSKITSLLTLSGGVSDIVRAGLQYDGLYERFLYVVDREYSLAFGENLAGEDIPFGLPTAQIPTNVLGNFTTCSY